MPGLDCPICGGSGQVVSPQDAISNRVEQRDCDACITYKNVQPISDEEFQRISAWVAEKVYRSRPTSRKLKP
jgi:hypothetical protein